MVTHLRTSNINIVAFNTHFLLTLEYSLKSSALGASPMEENHSSCSDSLSSLLALLAPTLRIPSLRALVIATCRPSFKL